MQLCALLSQLHRHQEALYHGQIAVRISHFLIRDLKNFIKSLVYREHFTRLEKYQSAKSKIIGKDGNVEDSKPSSSRIELKSNQSVESIKSNLMKSARDSKRENDNRNKKGLDGRLDIRPDQESIDSMDNEIETMSILVKGYKKVYPLIEFLEGYLIQEYTDEDEGFNGIPCKVIHDSDSELADKNNADMNEMNKNNQFSSPQGKTNSGSKDRINMIIRRQQRKFIRAQLAEAVKEEGVNAENLLGFINQKKLNSYLNISNIMRLKKLDFKDIYSTTDLDLYLLRESVLERFMLTITSYFCMGTELRFLKQLKVQGFKESIEAQFWHGRALEMAIALFPGDSPLVKHIIQSYQKHHAPSAEIIPEDYSISHEVKVAKPNHGVHANKAYPMIQNVDYIYDDEDISKEDPKTMNEFDKKRLENKRNCMIRITSLDMPKNDYLRFVKKIIYEFNLKEDQDPDKEPNFECEDGFDKEFSSIKGTKKDKQIGKDSDDINSNSVLEINNIIDSDEKPDEDEPIHQLTNKSSKKGKGKSKGSKQPSNVSTGAMMIREQKKTAEASTQYSPKNIDAKPKSKEIGVLVKTEPTVVKPKKPQMATVAVETDLKISCKEVNSEVSSLQSTGKKKSKERRKNSKHMASDFDEDFVVNNYDVTNTAKTRKRQRSNDKSKTKQKGSSYDSLKPREKYGSNTPECYINMLEEKRNAHTIHTQEDSPRSKRRVRRSMDQYQHPDFDNYLLHQTHYYHSLNAFPKGSKFQKDLNMRGMLFKQNNFKESLIRPNAPTSMMNRFNAQANSDKCVKDKKKHTGSNEIQMLYNPLPKKGYPQLKGNLTKAKTPSLPDSSQQTGRRKRSSSQCGSHPKRPKSTKNINNMRKYKAAAHQTSLNHEGKMHHVSHSIDQTTLISNERPSSVMESLRYSKADRKLKQFQNKTGDKNSISTSIDVPSIEISHNDNSFQNPKHTQNHLIYQKAAELIASNMNKNASSKSQAKNASNSQKIIRSTSRSGKAKSKTKIKSQFKKSGSNFDKSLNKSKEYMHRKSKSDAKKIANEIFNRNFKTNPKLRKSNAIDKILGEKPIGPRLNEFANKESPLGLPPQFLAGHINQNWIDSINHQIEENGKNLLDSINKAKKEQAQSISTTNKKRRKSKNRPQSSHYINIPQP